MGARVLGPEEPLLHTGATDCLPEGHPLADRSVVCDRCRVAVHAFNNECMRDWAETGKGNFCWDCFVALVGGDERGIWETWALPVAYARGVQRRVDENAQEPAPDGGEIAPVSGVGLEPTLAFLAAPRGGGCRESSR